VSPILQPQLHSHPHDQSVRRPFVRLARFEDYEEIAAVEARHGLTAKSRDQWLALWLENPAYLALGDWPIGWVVDDGEGHIVGSLGNIPSFCHLGGRRFVCASGRGWAVDVQYRAFSVSLLARQIKQSSSDLNVITTPSPTTAALCTQLGWSRVPVGQWDRSEFWVADYPKALQGYLNAKTPKFISDAVRTLTAPSLRLRGALSKSCSFPASHHQLDWCVTFDKRFDTFWEELRERRPDLLLVARNADTLRWHFKHALRQGRIWIVTASDGVRLTGYAIIERRDVPSVNLTRVLFVDFQTISKDSDLCSAMIQFALARCRREGIHILENAGCWMRKLQPIKSPPFRRSLEAWCYLYRITNPELCRIFGRPASWYPTQYDGDASL
jgi:hypothetical protein